MGPLQGYKILELAGIGPGPMAGMILADMGAEVIRIERFGAIEPHTSKDVSFRGKKSVVLNLKESLGVETLLRMVEYADCLIDPFRPGVCEKLGIGPDVCLQHNPRLVVGRITGWGQEGPLSQAAGHDINYIAITGALHAIGKKDDKPALPLNLIGDMGGGGMLLVNGILAALLETSKSGQGQVIDAAMVDGSAQLMWMYYGLQASDRWDETQRESNVFDGAAHFYDTYECADEEYVAIGSLEPQFYDLLIQHAELNPETFARQRDRKNWPQMKAELSKVFKQKTQAQWCEIMEGTDVCFAPVLNFMDATRHPANVEREVYIDVDGITQPAPAPRFSRTRSKVSHGAHNIGEDTNAVLSSMGFAEKEIANMRKSGVID